MGKVVEVTGLGEAVYPMAIEPSPHERYSVIPFNFSLPANGSDTQIYTLSKAWSFVAVIMNSFSTGAFNINIRDIYTQENLFINYVRGTLVTGDGKESFIMPKHHKFRAGNTISITVNDLSGAPNTIQVALIGYKESIVGKGIEVATVSKSTKYNVPIKERYVIDRLFAIPFNFTMAGSTYQDKFPISKGFDFMWEIFNSFSARDFTIQVKDEYVTEEFFISPVRNTLITGNGQRPFILPKPYIYEGGTTITVTITDTDPGGVATPVQLVMIGYKVKKVAV